MPTAMGFRCALCGRGPRGHLGAFAVPAPGRFLISTQAVPATRRILDENGRLIDVKSLAKRVAPAHPLDLAVLAIAGGGNDYLPGLQHSAPHLWSALKRVRRGRSGATARWTARPSRLS